GHAARADRRGDRRADHGDTTNTPTPRHPPRRNRDDENDHGERRDQPGLHAAAILASATCRSFVRKAVERAKHRDEREISEVAVAGDEITPSAIKKLKIAPREVSAK